MRRIVILLLTLLGFGLLAACGAQDVQTTVNQLSATSVTNLSSQLPSIEQAVAAGNTEEARTAFNTFIAGWDAIKQEATAQFPDQATAINSAMDEVKRTLINTDVPNADEVRGALTSLETAFNGLVSAIQ